MAVGGSVEGSPHLFGLCMRGRYWEDKRGDGAPLIRGADEDNKANELLSN